MPRSTPSGSTTSKSAASGPGAGAGADERTFDGRATAFVRALVLFGIMPAMVVAVVVALLVSPLVGLLALVLVAGVWAAAVLYLVRTSIDRLIASTGARLVEPGDVARWSNVVENLGVTTGVGDVELWVADGAEANALATASSDRVALVATTGLLDELTVVEMEGVAANLLGRVKDGSARYGTVTYGLLGGVLGTIEPAGRLVADGLGPQRDVQSDLVAVGFTRYPPGLAAALDRIAATGAAVPGAAPSSAHLWVAPVIDDAVGVDPSIAATAMQPLAYRAAVLREL